MFRTTASLSRHLILVLLTLGALSACSGEGGDTGNTAAAKPAATSSKKAMPDDPDLKSLYVQSCFSCHGTGAAGAPRTANAADWAPRLEKGMDTLLDHTINGFQGMPPLGMCMDCGEEEFTDLINFMAKP